ncbi:IS110 family transposase [Streptomyces albipurpureus]|uniref:Transposase n=1 Tax=Streptomyces albipurpureus TaxID=2897419 RepID=A0ABT0V304_9ACTN|nr:transposase [Streptomyces sp. CWNU-1]MCM2393923.1 transposase [Streptomyces sp. CWNU-1]
MFAGVDWADRWLDCGIVRRDGRRLGHVRIVYAETEDPVADYLAFLRKHNRTRWRTIPTGIEDPNLLFVEALADRGMPVVHIDATLAARARKASTLDSIKSDRADAYLLADMLRSGNDSLPRIVLPSPHIRALKVLAHAYGHAVASRASLLHQLRSVLKGYFPAAISAWPKLGLRHPQARAVLAAAPSPRRAAALDRAGYARALEAGNRWRTVDDEAHRLRLHFRRPALRTHPEVEDARAAEMLSALGALTAACERADDLKAQLGRQYRNHPWSRIVSSFPGIGDVIGGQVLAEVGDRLDRFTDARALCAYAGVVPVTWASGTSTRVSMRRSANKPLRSALFQAAFCMTAHSPGAKAYYAARRARSADHPTTIRNMGIRITRSLYHCLQTGVLYDEAAAWPQQYPGSGVAVPVDLTAS